MEIKPGYKTTEFWVTLATALVGPVVMVLVGFGVFSSDVDQAAVTSELTTAFTSVADTVGAVIALIISSSAAKRYTGARTDVKTLNPIKTA